MLLVPVVVGLIATASPCIALEKRSLGAKPQMGWNSWNSFKYNFNQSVIEKTAQSLVSDGLARAGYSYVVLDAGWQAMARDSSGRQQFNATKFPDGAGHLTNYVHKLGLKIGLYSDAGIYDCGFYPGSYGYEELDAQTYANWGFDYLKYDNCGGFHAGTISPQERFAIMKSALLSSGREILYSICQWGQEFPWFWADQISESYRMSGDIYSSFSVDRAGVCKTAYCLNTGYAGCSVLTIINKMREISSFQTPGSWADMDMLEVGTGTMNEFQEQTHQSFWAALKSPLIIGADITKMNKTSLNILLNKEIIEINQDALGVAVSYIPGLSVEGKIQVWAGPLQKGYVILALNYGNTTADISIPWSKVPALNTKSPSPYRVRDIWAAKELGVLTDSITLKNVSVDQTKVLRLFSL